MRCSLWDGKCTLSISNVKKYSSVIPVISTILLPLLQSHSYIILIFLFISANTDLATGSEYKPRGPFSSGPARESHAVRMAVSISGSLCACRHDYRWPRICPSLQKRALCRRVMQPAPPAQQHSSDAHMYADHARFFSPGWRAVFGLIKPGESSVLHSRVTAAIRRHLKGMKGNYLREAIPWKQRLLGRCLPWTGRLGIQRNKPKWCWLLIEMSSKATNRGSCGVPLQLEETI